MMPFLKAFNNEVARERKMGGLMSKRPKQFRLVFITKSVYLPLTVAIFWCGSGPFYSGTSCAGQLVLTVLGSITSLLVKTV